MIKSKLIGKYKNISHGFFNKSDGHSDGIYRSLNCGKGSKDNKNDINNNLKKVCQKIGCSKNKLVLLNQTQSNKVISINISSQREFLLKMGILERAEIISKNLPFSKKSDIYFRLKRLIDKRQMGSLFKVLFATSKKNNFSLGF